MFGYASDETEELMPLPIVLAHRLTRRLAEVRKDGTLPYLRPDGKAQVTVRYQRGADGGLEPLAVERVLISTQHAPGLDAKRDIRPDLLEQVVAPSLPRRAGRPRRPCATRTRSSSTRRASSRSAGRWATRA